jgi:hypothetical protein
MVVAFRNWGGALAGHSKDRVYKNTHICLIKPKYNDSPVWCDLLRARHIYLKGREFVVKNGKLASFWVDS